MNKSEECLIFTALQNGDRSPLHINFKLECPLFENAFSLLLEFADPLPIHTNNIQLRKKQHRGHF